MQKEKKKITLKDVDTYFKKCKAKGMKPFLKGKGSGKIKVEFE